MFRKDQTLGDDSIGKCKKKHNREKLKYSSMSIMVGRSKRKEKRGKKPQHNTDVPLDLLN